MAPSSCGAEFVNAGRFYGADVLVMGGDLSGKAVVPVIERRPGRWEAAFAGRRVTATNEPASDRARGGYPLQRYVSLPLHNEGGRRALQ